MIGQAFLATFRAILADRAALLLLVGSAIVYSFFYPAAYSGEVVVRIPVAVVDNDHTAASRAFIIKAQGLQQAEIVAQAASSQEALRLMSERRIDAFVLIPAGFERAVLRGEQGHVALYGNGAFLLRSSTSLASLGTALAALGREAAVGQAMATGAPAAAPLAVTARPLFNTREGYGATVVPGVTFLIIQQTMVMGIGMLAATRREARGPHALSPAEFTGTALAFFAIGLSVVLYYIGFVFWFQDYPRAAARALTLAVSATLFVAAVVCGALALGSFFRTRERPVQLWILTSLPIFFLSNLSWPVEQTPAWLAALARLLPTTPGIHLMVGANQMGASLGEQAPELANLLLLILLYGTIAYARLVSPPPRPRRRGDDCRRRLRTPRLRS
ncbi:ABC transporter permease [Phenylobacterium sp.]|uniref:ABC transporter permease n=1 Tax=Phenylobacterium sp. TaxID=1871053 RepID=UPI0035AE820E